MTAWWNGNLFVEIAFDDTPLTATASCTWVDVTTYVRGVSINRGRQTELSTYSPGTCTVQLDNLTRLFDPSNSAGTYYGKLLPMKRIRVRASIGATSATIFAGFVMGWPIAYPGMVDSVVGVNAIDGTRVLEQFTLADSAYETEVLADSPAYYWEMQGLDDGGNLVATVGNVDMPPGAVFFSGTEPLLETTTAGSVPYGAARSMHSGRATATISSLAELKGAEAWITQLSTASGTIQVRTALSTTNYFALASSSVFYSNSTDNKQVPGGVVTITAWADAYVALIEANEGSMHIAAMVDATNVYAYLNGQLVQTIALVAGTTAQSGLSSSVPGISITSSDADTAVSHVAFYNSAISTARVLAHYNAGTVAYGHPTGEATGTRLGRVLDAVGWPSADRNISTGTTTVGKWLPQGASALSQARSLESTEQGLFFIGADGSAVFRDRQWQMDGTLSVVIPPIFGDGALEIPYQDVTIDGNLADFVRNTISVSYGGGTVWAEDATSQTNYGEQSDSVSATELPTWGGWLARQLANFRLRARKDPFTRVPAITVKWRKDLATWLPYRLTFELGDRATVKRRPTGGTGTIELLCAVQGIQDTITTDDWTTTFYLAPAPTSYHAAPYLTMGDATYGKIGAADGNLVPY